MAPVKHQILHVLTHSSRVAEIMVVRNKIFEKGFASGILDGLDLDRTEQRKIATNSRGFVRNIWDRAVSKAVDWWDATGWQTDVAKLL